jgi:hypothetical protein
MTDHDKHCSRETNCSACDYAAAEHHRANDNAAKLRETRQRAEAAENALVEARAKAAGLSDLAAENREGIRVWPPASWCAALNPERTHMCDKPRGHAACHEGPELPTVQIDESREEAGDD